MPVIYTHASTAISTEQSERLKAIFGQAISLLPGKSENWLMCLFDANVTGFFAGDGSQPVAFIEVNAFGRNEVPQEAWEKLTETLMPAVGQELGIEQNRIYIRYLSSPDWGWNGSNF